MSAARAALLDALVEEIAERSASLVVERLRPLLAEQSSESGYYDQDSAPVPKRTYLNAARAGEFPSGKRGRRVVARKTDVDAWLAIGRGKSKPVNDPPEQRTLLEQTLALNGISIAPAPAPPPSRKRA